ncbi:MAG: histidinol-phosphatase HisJ family protein [Bacilli bacterium]|nr:histidinol-phosphatase HisJ family protein [Bacilli bacterium]
MKDMHVHSTFSPTGKSSVEAYIAAAKDKGVDEIAFTEHFDLDNTMKSVNLNAYKIFFNRLKQKSDFKINYGLEVGLQPDLKEDLNRHISKYLFDFIIGSSHTVLGKNISTDGSYYEGITRHEAYLNYFKEVLQNIKTFENEFDVYGHLDYIGNFGNYPEKRLDYIEFFEIIDSILQELIKKDKGIELNTSGLRDGFGFMYPSKNIIKRYKELGGKIITVGSDSYDTSTLAENFNEAYDILEDAGFHETAVYHNRKPEFVKIKDLRR